MDILTIRALDEHRRRTTGLNAIADPDGWFTPPKTHAGSAPKTGPREFVPRPATVEEEFALDFERRQPANRATMGPIEYELRQKLPRVVGQRNFDRKQVRQLAKENKKLHNQLAAAKVGNDTWGRGETVEGHVHAQ
jgi:hypothetical protein